MKDTATGRFIREHDIVTVSCPCGSEFKTTTGKQKNGRGKYCSKDCFFRFRTVVSGELHHSYKRDLSDWVRLCSTCHHSYDDISTRGWETKKGVKNV